MKIVKILKASCLIIGACGIVLDPVITLVHSKRLPDDGGPQLTVCEVLYADAGGRPTFAVAQTLFSLTVAFSAVTAYENKYLTIAIWIYINVLLELISYGTPYSGHQILHVGMNIIAYTSAFFMNVYTAAIVKSKRIHVAAIILAGAHLLLVGSDAVYAWSKNYYSFFVLEMTGLYSYCILQIIFIHLV
jgi:hypothetical protein